MQSDHKTLDTFIWNQTCKKKTKQVFAIFAIDGSGIKSMQAHEINDSW